MSRTTLYGLLGSALFAGQAVVSALNHGLSWQAALNAGIAAVVGLLGYHASDSTS